MNFSEKFIFSRGTITIEVTGFERNSERQKLMHFNVNNGNLKNNYFSTTVFFIDKA
jgi:hypothetical protein